MATTKEIQALIGSYLPDWFADAADDGFDVPIDNSQIKAYLTSPDENASSPNWCILGGIHTKPESFVMGGMNEESVFAILLFSRISAGDDAEASRAAAEAWITDAEEMVVTKLANHRPVRGYFGEINVRPPGRDKMKHYWGKFRTSQIIFTVEK